MMATTEFDLPEFIIRLDAHQTEVGDFTTLPHDIRLEIVEPNILKVTVGDIVSLWDVSDYHFPLD